MIYIFLSKPTFVVLDVCIKSLLSGKIYFLFFGSLANSSMMCTKIDWYMCS